MLLRFWLLITAFAMGAGYAAAAEPVALAAGLPEGWRLAPGGAMPEFKGGAAVIERSSAGPIQVPLGADVREVRIRFRLGDPALVGFGVGIESADAAYAVSVRDDGMFGWVAPTPHYAGPRWVAGFEYEVRFLFGESDFHTELVMEDGIPRSTGHLGKYAATLQPGWRTRPLWLTIGGAAKDASGSTELLTVQVIHEGEDAEQGEAGASTIEQSLTKYRRLRQGSDTEAIAAAVERLRRHAGPLPPRPPRVEVQAWDAQKLGPLLATDEGVRRLAQVYTLLQMRRPPEPEVVERLRRHDLGFSLYINTRQPRYVEALAASPNVLTMVRMKGELRERVNVFSGDWLELSAIGTLHEVRAALAQAPLRRILLDSEYATGVGEDPLTRAALEADEPGAPLAGLELGNEHITRVYTRDDPAWRAALWDARWGMSNVGHRTIATAVRTLWPGIEVVTDPIDDRAGREQFRGLDAVQHWIRVHWAPRNPRSVAYYVERGRVHVRNHEMVGSIVIGPQLGRDTRPTPPDMLSEACWLAVAFGARGITHWGQQAIFEEDGTYRPGGEAAWVRLARLKRELYEPLSEQMLTWEPVPRRMAMLVSQADAITAAGRRNTHDEACENTYRALLSTGEPCDVVYDAEVREGALQRYQVLVVPSLHVADDELVGKVRDFVSAGGTVVAHRESVLQDLPGVHIIDRNLVPRYRDYWIRKDEPSLFPHEYAAFLAALAVDLQQAIPFAPAIEIGAADVIGNLMQTPEAKYLVLVNDARTYGDEAEALGDRYMLDRGEPKAVRIRVEGVDRYVDAMTGHPVVTEGRHAVVELEPGWGRVLRLE